MEPKAINKNYWIDENGVIYSKLRAGSKGGVVKQWIDGGGYYNVRLTIEGQMKNLKVHRLYANAYLPNPDKKPQINHKDGNKLNNKLENLEWCTSQENMQHASDTGLKKYHSNSGEKYIYYESKPNSYRVIISHKGEKYKLGRFKQLSEAIKIRNEFKYE